VLGAVSSLVLIYISPAIQVEVLKNASAPFLLKNPALISMLLAFIGGILVSLATRDRRSEQRFVGAERQIHLGAAAPPAPEPTPPALPAER
jgi:cation/acetate symporter